ncbi:hypothetical protein J3Q64DRAFT_1696898 [Phycomyces blakesleeanus]|uniref:Uncharacterized protein n=2 Tax=Phycomyces blakesleeanus TaxID=4837 RepID=A0A167NJ50_PHYB8|nr:hypothetical protein PHYBLDRAFT_59584 [Phycomyces blakesleeanus NRRL 1555(-)]OAD76050.1 hypothetical protein PHYBLDRAFT_59584 [Phycomyces blakesleeanus NRRL 1555(-)]|eukprot:XP_018294090.1 hypothetical protein PHYBLDRAFT_59584 [Phycomyces blakesleeanus NRRL 1555(-)]
MILDLQDKKYLKKGVSTEAEIEEMKIKNPIQIISPIPKELATYINASNLTNVKDLRAELLKAQDWEINCSIDKDHGLDRAKNTTHSFVRLYESGNLKTAHKKEWHNGCEWSLINNIFDDLENLQVASVEISSAATIKRKKFNRVIGAKDKIARFSVGHKYDLIIRENNVQHEHAYEYCVSKTAIQYQNTKKLE